MKTMNDIYATNLIKQKIFHNKNKKKLLCSMFIVII